MEDKTNELIRLPPIYIAFRYASLPADQGTGVSFLGSKTAATQNVNFEKTTYKKVI